MYLLDACDKLIEPFAEHSENVARTSLMIYQNLPDIMKRDVFPREGKWKPEELVVMCGLYHDIGKSYIEDFYPELITKKSYTEKDRLTIKQHTLMGAQLIQNLYERFGFEDYVAVGYLQQTCLMHHEKLDGSGYWQMVNPPKIAQLVTVADIYSAGIEKRCYEADKSSERLVEEMYSQRINQEYVDALVRGLRK